MIRQVRGAALILVLWLLVLLIGVVGLFALTAGGEAIQGSQALVQARLQYAAESGVDLVARRMMAADPGTRLIPDGRIQTASVFGFDLQIALRDESGKIDLNASDFTTFRNLFLAVGVSPDEAPQLAAAIIDWRDADDLVQPEGGAEDRDYRRAGRDYPCKNAAFESVAELQRVLGVSEALARQVSPYLTVFTGLAQPNPAFAEDTVLRALGYSPEVISLIMQARANWQPGLGAPAIPGLPTLAANGTGTYSISSRATRPSGPTVEIRTVIRMGSGDSLGQFYQTLVWEIGEQQ